MGQLMVDTLYVRRDVDALVLYMIVIGIVSFLIDSGLRRLQDGIVMPGRSDEQAPSSGSRRYRNRSTPRAEAERSTPCAKLASDVKPGEFLSDHWAVRMR